MTKLPNDTFLRTYPSLSDTWPYVWSLLMASITSVCQGSPDLCAEVYMLVSINSVADTCLWTSARPSKIINFRSELTPGWVSTTFQSLCWASSVNIHWDAQTRKLRVIFDTSHSLSFLVHHQALLIFLSNWLILSPLPSLLSCLYSHRCPRLADFINLLPGLPVYRCGPLPSFLHMVPEGFLKYADQITGPLASPPF